VARALLAHRKLALERRDVDHVPPCLGSGGGVTATAAAATAAAAFAAAFAAAAFAAFAAFAAAGREQRQQSATEHKGRDRVGRHGVQ
jgi:hypothetical protein